MAAPNRPLDSRTLEQFNEWVRDDGPGTVATTLGTSIATVARANARFPVAPLTARAIKSALDARGSDPNPVRKAG